MARTPEAPRTGAQRKRDVLTRLSEDEDAWVATAAPDGEPCLVPLSFLWWDDTLLINTRRANPTARNVARDGRAVVSLGHTRDVVLIDATGEVLPDGALPEAVGEAFVAKAGWDPRGRGAWVFMRLRPRGIRAWREVNEMDGRHLMRDGHWLV
ncbi:pyridoxamine 5'-phosphate oxidase [Streptomyces sp. 3MP-14]|uniref:Pyridoxamine 5'-phosphate oxidase n=1 Tax=Streptomyces mimosae TaxID=2586635 RepID=A0A5N6AMW1_9ACTN|nr:MULTISPECIES: pyridoxamine 5'-phosphate oxidase family protein [Streptomyces]KAB8169974.1 pyridoxamine 5'-phosphate oxidase [Streptomyces mimosae]KAB8178722.1 pyridoxamine 5'-phosphate oxidase [Streptomyces sp. 3MP-14]